MHKKPIAFHHTTRLPRLVVFDLDGTLLNRQHSITRRSINALSLLQQAKAGPALQSSPITDNQSDQQINGQGDIINNGGSSNSHDNSNNVQIMLASGRSPRSVQLVIDLFEGIVIPDAVICCNGALNYNPRTKVITHPQFIPLDQATVVVQQLRSEISTYGTPKSRIPLSKNPNEMGLGGDLRPLPPLENDQSNEPRMAGRPGFACEVIWFLGKDEKTGEVIYAPDTTFVCDRTWELHRKHAIYYEYTVLRESMETFLQSLLVPSESTGMPKGGIVKLMALDRNRSAPDLFESLPPTLRSINPTTTNTERMTGTGTGTTGVESAGIDAEAALAGNVSNSISIASPQISITYSGMYFLEISAAGVNKGLGLINYCKSQGIAHDDVVAFGDLLNDAEMLQVAGLGLCMGNGHADMKKLADRVIGSNADDGVAKEIESWFA
ncbi:hypothetical protein BX616_007015 [Lobosporangium transversale]|uniref:HAD-like domain-containing protein n=1 Tax=Lobosporangium transversale TaxID=64571 RepID=A0A1Y2GZZ5_9FUNG|nr:hypothetical protein BCR41DRAFT_346168 [Lobosporangium transversale]KAF9896650.1 hypothetical protein BX616_007015 [Lobosporangium transversale]ORZ27877.1 hypothetical protein BCR41DRAFT_346168 [Lobosporangium transversale]|eukprot:XP_021885580.1 hypothetical protein BCR41DRAFT_346168 [Lobosporangium transversale]